MTDIEQRLRSELQRMTEPADPASIRPLRVPPPRRGTRLARWLAPVAAVAAVTGVIVGLDVAGQFSGQPRPHPSAPLASPVITSRVTIVDGLRLSRIMQSLAAQSGIPLSQFQAAARDTAALGLPPYADGQLEGFLYPDTYSVAPGESALQILQTAVTQFNNEVAPLHLQTAAAAVGFDARAIIIGASLLEAEVPPQYFGDAARVIDNRLNTRPPLDLALDSPLAYALNKPASKLTTSDLDVKSPYNTFLYTGLPPGPIDSPDIAAIQAFLHPASGPWLYFVTVDKKGTTKFTASFTQFQVYAAEAKANGVG